MKILKNCVLIVLLFLLSACASTNSNLSASKIPYPKPGMVIVGNATKADREIRVFSGSYNVNELKTCNAQGNEVLAVPSLNLLQTGERYLVFKSEEIVSLQIQGKWKRSFTIPCSYMRLKGSKMASQTAVLYLKPDSRYTLYVRDLRITGELLGERTIRFKTSCNSTNDKRRTHLGTIWADKIIDLPRVDTSGPSRIGISINFDPWN